ncbi:GNAT family N-acetyltransferase [Sanguibacter suaedae]|uniref:GNAT family N-acetyltransferase n=1 Tax=Sanguibacter suaedae TaxID=2795737 RepID=A0A934M9Z9_9MICO|nr:GNAT family N-acetyltransferase [Sanguibacter suaedae]MBI9113711.1 GNAT family N-acetyltransferase [Sanguibacter suaedae]
MADHVQSRTTVPPAPVEDAATTRDGTPDGAGTVTVRPTTPDDWKELRALRLEMLRDTPEAYGETLDDALRHDEAEWRSRGARGTAPGGTFVVAVEPAGRWVGIMGGRQTDPDAEPMLYGVYVAPSHRGRDAGVADALLDAVEDWARTMSGTLRLTVHEDNHRAQAFYARRGYRLTGTTSPYPLDETRRELEMRRALNLSPGG